MTSHRCRWCLAVLVSWGWFACTNAPPSAAPARTDEANSAAGDEQDNDGPSPEEESGDRGSGRDARDDGTASPHPTDAGITDLAASDDPWSPQPDVGVDAEEEPGADVLGTPIPVEGFGAGTRGGWQPGNRVVHVTSLADEGPGTLREVTQTGDTPTVVVFDADGDITLSRPITLPSNISIDGRGRKVRLREKGFLIPGSDEVVVTNLAIVDVHPNTEDGIMIGVPGTNPSERVVIDHVAFEQADDTAGDADNVDEAISVIFGSRNVTIAWCRFLRWEKVMLFGNGDTSVDVDGAITVTVHHNWAHATGRRHPQARYGFYDFYNNFWDDWRMFNWAYITDKESFGAQAQNGARILFENNVARRNNHPYDFGSQANEVTRCESAAIIDERGTYITPDSEADLQQLVDCPRDISPIVRPYAATVDPADDALRARLEWVETGNVL